MAGLSRMLFTLAQEEIASKDDALRFMLDAAPGEYHDILVEVLRVRTGHGVRRYSSVFRRRREMLSFMEYAISHFDTGEGNHHV